MVNPWISTQSKQDHLDLISEAAITVAAEDTYLEPIHHLKLNNKKLVIVAEDGKEDMEKDKEAGREEGAISNSRHKGNKRITSPRRSKSEPLRLRTTTRTKHLRVQWNESIQFWPRPAKKKETELRS